MKRLTTILCLLVSISAFAQTSTSLTMPRTSQFSSVTQRIGLTDITVQYHSPAVKGRTVWGGLVPYDKVWRAGANENTTITFTDDVSIEGSKLAAGTYGLHMIPTKDKWTVIFSKNHTSWGSYFYNKSEDALRVQVTPKSHTHVEWLNYAFIDKSENSATLALLWEKLSIPVKIDVDVNAIVVANMKNELRTLPGFTWEGFYAAADFCYHNNIELDQSIEWIEKADHFNPNNFSIMKLKANLYERKGKTKEAKELISKAVEFSTENELNSYGYELLADNKTDRAAEIFKQNIERHPKSWNAYDSYGEALEKQGKKKEAIQAYEKALKNSPTESQVNRISETIKKLKEKS